MQVEQISSWTTGLSVTPPATGGFGVSLHLVDTDEVPLDRRYRITSKSSYPSQFTADSDAENWCAGLWGQNYNPEIAYVGRWAKTATSPYFVCGSPAAFSATWTAVTAGDFAVTDGSTTEQFTTATMAGATSLADVAAIIETEVQTSSSFAADLSAATVTVDVLGRIVLTSADTGAEATVYAIIAPTGGSGTDITGATLLNIASNAFSVAGIDAEDPDDALAAICAIDNTPFIVTCGSSPSIDQMVALAAALQMRKKIGEFKITDANAKNSAYTTDLMSLLSAGGNNNVHCVYTEHTAQQVDAAICGEIYTRPEGSAGPAFIDLQNMYESGLDPDGITPIPLTDEERLALEGKGCDYLVKPSSTVHCINGLTPGGIEIRHRIGLYWVDKRCSDAGYALLKSKAAQNQVVTFSDDDIQALGGIYKSYVDVQVARKAIEAGYTLSLPSAAEFDATVKATHIMELSDIATLMAQFAVTRLVVTSSATV